MKWKDYSDELHLDMTLYLRRTGAYHPGKMSGPPGDCCPEEYEDERRVEAIDVDGRTYQLAELPAAVVEWFEALADDANLLPPWNE